MFQTSGGVSTWSQLVIEPAKRGWYEATGALTLTTKDWGAKIRATGALTVTCPASNGIANGYEFELAATNPAQNITINRAGSQHILRGNAAVATSVNNTTAELGKLIRLRAIYKSTGSDLDWLSTTTGTWTYV